VAKEIDRVLAAIDGQGASASKKAPYRRVRLKWLLIPAAIVAAVLVPAMILIDRLKMDYVINCLKYGCELDYVTYRSRVMGLEFVYPRRHLMLNTMHEAELRLPLFNHQDETEVILFRSALPSHGDPRRGSAEEQEVLRQEGNIINYVGPQIDPEKKNFYVVTGIRPDGRTFYFRRWYTVRDVVSVEYVYRPESIPLYDKVIVDMTIRSIRFDEPRG
jgi:hypothetical protein